MRDVLGDAVEFIAIPEYMSDDRQKSFTTGFIDNLTVWAEEYGARCVKHWAAPRMWDVTKDFDDPYAVAALDGAWRRKVADRAAEAGMMMMAHVADPDTWFAAKYTDAGLYGTKDEQYDRLERMLEAYDMPWLIAHMLGSPEDLTRIADIMRRYPKMVLDTSATKWQVRELSKHPDADFVALFTEFEGRILFGSDIVTSDEHLTPSDPDSPRFGVQLASSEDEAFDLYASRYWALRTMFETDYEGESNIADPDLQMVDPDNHDAMSAAAQGAVAARRYVAGAVRRRGRGDDAGVVRRAPVSRTWVNTLLRVPADTRTRTATGWGCSRGRACGSRCCATGSRGRGRTRGRRPGG